MGNYSLDSVQKLDFFSAVRKYPGMYIGSKDEDGLHHLAKEIISNSIDEYLNGSCSKIEVTLLKDGSLNIVDNGRGIPIGTKDNGKSALEMCFTEEHAGGKFLNATGESGYNSAGGMHGLGTKCVNALSKKMYVSSTRDGQTEKLEFTDGVLTKREVVKTASGNSGVSVTFLPDPQYLEVVTFDAKRLKTMVEEFSFLCKDLTFVFADENDNTKETFLSKRGLFDYLEYMNKGKDFLCNPFYFEEGEGTFNVEVAFGYNSSYGSNVKLYTNNIPQTKGTHLTGFKSAFTSCFNKFAREKKWLKEKEENLSGSDFEEGQLLIINFKMIDPVFKGQNKEELSSTEGRTYVQRFASKALPEIFERNEKAVKVVFDKAISARKAREAAKKARDSARNNAKDKKSKLINLPTKLVDAWSKDRSKCELFICEGDSAAGGLVDGRDSEFIAVFPVRGKVIAAYKNKSEKIFANQEVVNIIKAIGLDIDEKTGKLVYNKSKLRYGKILLAADGDSDGSNIRNLLIELFWWLCPEIIINGHLYTTMPPLYRITTKSGKFIFLKDDEELNQYKAQHEGQKYLINRNKGLGEQDSDELSEALLNPATRNVAQLTVEDIEAARNLIEVLMGPEVPPRRAYLLEHEKEANEDE